MLHTLTSLFNQMTCVKELDPLSICVWLVTGALTRISDDAGDDRALSTGQSLSVLHIHSLNCFNKPMKKV